jgi:hypothetical protein
LVGVVVLNKKRKKRDWFSLFLCLLILLELNVSVRQILFSLAVLGGVSVFIGADCMALCDVVFMGIFQNCDGHHSFLNSYLLS